MYGRNDTCTRFSLKWLWFMDIKMKKFYLDLFQRLTVGEFTRYVTVGSMMQCVVLDGNLIDEVGLDGNLLDEVPMISNLCAKYVRMMYL